MDEGERAEFVLGLAAGIRDSLRAVLEGCTGDEDEREQMAGAVIALLLRDMYKSRGNAWLERILRQVLKE